MSSFIKKAIFPLLGVLYFSIVSRAQDNLTTVMRWTQNSVTGAYYSVDLMESEEDENRFVRLGLQSGGPEGPSFLFPVTKIERTNAGGVTLWAGEILDSFNPGVMLLVNENERSLLHVLASTSDYSFNEGLNAIGLGAGNWTLEKEYSSALKVKTEILSENPKKYPKEYKYALKVRLLEGNSMNPYFFTPYFKKFNAESLEEGTFKIGIKSVDQTKFPVWGLIHARPDRDGIATIYWSSRAPVSEIRIELNSVDSAPGDDDLEGMLFYPRLKVEGALEASDSEGSIKARIPVDMEMPVPLK